MKSLIFIILATMLFTGCDSQTIENNPMKVETTGELVSALFVNNCQDIPTVYYETQEDTVSYFQDIQGMNVYWDTRYTAENNSTICNEGLEFSTSLDTTTNTAPVEFGGPQSTLIYRFAEKRYPWSEGDNLMMQAEFRNIIYNNINTNIGGTVSFNMFIRNKYTDERINYVIAVYALGDAWKQEQPDVLYDPTTSTSFVGTVVRAGTKYVTMSQISSELNDTDGFFRVNITKENMLSALEAKGLSDISIADWYMDFIGVQFELEEEGGDATLYGEFKGFSAYVTKGAM